jgi:hypothetical protein
MTKPGNFILTSDYATIANDGQATGTVAVPASVAVPANGSRSFSTDLTVGGQGAATRSRIQSSKIGSKFYVGSVLASENTGTVLGIPGSPYTTYAFITRINATTARLLVYIPNPYSDPLTSDYGSVETFTFVINTFVPPFA